MIDSNIFPFSFPDTISIMMKIIPWIPFSTGFLFVPGYWWSHYHLWWFWLILFIESMQKCHKICKSFFWIIFASLNQRNKTKKFNNDDKQTKQNQLNS